jgi:hypothetical protein
MHVLRNLAAPVLACTCTSAHSMHGKVDPTIVPSPAMHLTRTQADAIFAHGCAHLCYACAVAAQGMAHNMLLMCGLFLGILYVLRLDCKCAGQCLCTHVGARLQNHTPCDIKQVWADYKAMAAKFGTDCAELEARATAVSQKAVVTEVTAKLITAFLDKGITKVQLRKYVQTKYKELKAHGLSEKVLDKRILRKCSSALLLK